MSRHVPQRISHVGPIGEPDRYYIDYGDGRIQVSRQQYRRAERQMMHGHSRADKRKLRRHHRA